MQDLRQVTPAMLLKTRLSCHLSSSSTLRHSPACSTIRVTEQETLTKIFAAGRQNANIRQHTCHVLTTKLCFGNRSSFFDRRHYDSNLNKWLRHSVTLDMHKSYFMGP